MRLTGAGAARKKKRRAAGGWRTAGATTSVRWMSCTVCKPKTIVGAVEQLPILIDAMLATARCGGASPRWWSDWSGLAEITGDSPTLEVLPCLNVPAVSRAQLLRQGVDLGVELAHLLLE